MLTLYLIFLNYLLAHSLSLTHTLWHALTNTNAPTQNADAVSVLSGASVVYFRTDGPVVVGGGAAKTDESVRKTNTVSGENGY